MDANQYRSTPIPPFFALLIGAAQAAITYRLTVITTFLANLVWLFIPLFFWQSVYESTSSNSLDAPLNWEQLKTYIVLSFMLNLLLSFRIEANLYNIVRSGDVILDLLRPISYLRMRFAGALGASVAEIIIVSPALMLIAILLIQISVPHNLVVFLLFLESVAVSFCIKFLIVYVTGLICFWTMNAVGLIWMRSAVTNIFSGALVPLQFLPNPLHQLAFVLPFHAIIYTPVSIYLWSNEDIGALVITQHVWLVILYLTARLLLGPSLRRLTVQGG